MNKIKNMEQQNQHEMSLNAKPQQSFQPNTNRIYIYI